MEGALNRSKFFIITVLLGLLTLSACDLPFVAKPTGQPTSFNNPTQTSIALTLAVSSTADQFTSTPNLVTVTPGPSGTFTQTPVFLVQTPEQFVYYYFANINSRNYSLTWSLLTDRFKR
jgi:hypothetical protein